MATDWYYAQNNQQQGPVSGQDLLALEKAGHLLPGTLVWRSGMPNWIAWSSVAADARAEAGAQPAPAGDVAVCAFSGRVLPLSQMVKYGEHFIAAEHKDAFVQSLREGSRVQAMSGSAELQPVGFWWRVLSMIVDGLVLMVPNMLLMLPYMFFSIQGTVQQGGSANAGDPFSQFQQNPTMALAYVGGMLGTFLVLLVYETWMVGKFGGTVGKLALGFRVVKADGDHPTYGRAFGRWAAKVLTNLVWMVPMYGAFGLGLVAQLGAAKGGGQDDSVSPVSAIAFLFGSLWLLVGGFGYYMAGWTKRKQALHDKVASTLVVRKSPV
jgi:uncharacterized RDD family membrane protein YckC